MDWDKYRKIIEKDLAQSIDRIPDLRDYDHIYTLLKCLREINSLALPKVWGTIPGRTID